MRQLATVVAVLLLSVCGVADLRADDAEIHRFLRVYVEAFNKQDLAAVSSMWTENSTHVDRETGERTDGRAGIRADLAEVFKRPAKTRLAGSVERIRFIKPDVASVEGASTILVAGEEPNVSKFSAILVKQGNDWQIDSIEETAVPVAEGGREALRDLDWLKGTWIDDAKQTPVVSTFGWSGDGAFLVRSIASKDGEKTSPLGTQVIGWDPRNRQIRSWTFNADGSFGEGVWSKAGNDWSIKSTQTLSDGRTAAGTYVISRTDNKSLRMRLVGHEVGGEPMPKSEPTVLVRMPDSSKPVPGASKPNN